MNKNNAWMLRQDGAAFDLMVHIYAEGDDNLDSEAECAAFIIRTKSKDVDLANRVIDAWLALLIEDSVKYTDETDEDIDKRIADAVSRLPYHFSYPLTLEQLINIHHNCNNYNNVDSLYEFIDSLNISELQQSIRDSINQQFCRVRYGGQYNSGGMNGGIWFRISSVSFNWANTIYLFVSEIKRRYPIEYITICRDSESDYGSRDDQDEYFYKAKDGTPYYMMPISEYLVEEHENNPVFASASIGEGIFAYISRSLQSGYTFEYVKRILADNDVSLRHAQLYNVSKEIRRNCISAADLLDSESTVTRRKFIRVMNKINALFPIIHVASIDERPRDNRSGNAVGVTLSFKLISKVPELDGVVVDIASTKPVSTLTSDIIVRNFRKEFIDYCNYKGIRI